MNAHVSPPLKAPLPSLAEVARRMVPRYTSYPTAPHFSPAVTPQAYAGWLEQVGTRDEAVSLYLHIPFCRSICAYCGCTTKASLRDEPIRAYAAALHREIALVAAHVGRVPVSHLHWGGGTPNILPPDCMAELIDDLATRFNFQAAMEHAIELDPRHVTPDGARHLAALGVNRASLGIQTLDADVQAAIGRIQPFDVVATSFAALRDAGIDAVNADLMYGLPLQTLAMIEDTARRILTLRPSRIAIFGYAHVPWMKSNQRLIDTTALANSETRMEQAALARAIFEAAGYVEIGIDHFAAPDDPLALARKDGQLRRNFQGYTDDAATTLIGIGASSISRTPQGFAQNAPDNLGWQRAIEAGMLPTVRGKAFEGEDVMRAEIIEALLCGFDVDLAAVSRRHGVTPATFADALERLQPLIEAGFVARDGDHIVILRHRHEIARVVASEFDTYLSRGGRHSVAV
ncbi:oxygen-independent coproporphyrinogen III oxidase [Mesorhizobium sp. BR1-1-16]|uniref:oxygen-independent coproporphyrinogen III oxidase n=1 Tax=Mesorhizobium sp. BR1-1-16 TaxID=2876653 RepID=UPI001CCBBBB8|nr:oxygen-independent coproporphyrinogen III oxidase [Mesorhizobium sp. BR1-1-16]MBZ9938546.1 oxygen-independent coproporphyrinogen III oxidase [Mesorhizobium sp. BR1-1-16]